MEAENIFGEAMAADIRNLLEGNGNPQQRFYIFQNFFRGIHPEGINILPSETTVGTNRIGVSGLAQRLFFLLSILSPGTIAYLILNLSDGGSNSFMFLKYIFQAFRVVLTSGVPINTLLCTKIKILKLSFLRALKFLQYWLRNLLISIPSLVIEEPLIRQRLLDAQGVAQERFNVNNEGALIIAREQADAVIEANLQNLNEAGQNHLDEQRLVLNNLEQANARQQADIARNNDAVIAAVGQGPLARILARIGRVVPPGALFFGLGSFLFYNRQNIIGLGQQALRIFQPFLRLPPNNLPGLGNTGPVEVLVPVPVPNNIIQSITRLFNNIDFSSVDLDRISEVLFFLGGF